MVVVEIRRRRLRVGCQVGLRQASVDMGPCQHGSRQPARFCKKSLLLLAASSATACCCCCSRCCCCTRVHTRAAEYPSVSPARGITLSQMRKRSKASGLRHSRGKPGQSKASGESLANRMRQSNLLSPLPIMTNLPISSQTCLGFVISRR